MPSSLKPLFDEIWLSRQRAPLAASNQRVEKAAAWLAGGGCLLDLGAGPCDLAQYARQYHSIVAVDFSTIPLQSAHLAGALPVIADFVSGGLPFSSGIISTVALLSALQYADDPRDVLRECYRVLQPGGQLLLSVPNMRLWTRLVKLVLLGRFPRVSGGPGYDGGTRHYFTRRDACLLLEQTGFRDRRWSGAFPRPSWAGVLPAEFFHAEILIDAVKI
jgi:SAM-dependent methyltransferase